MKMFFYNVSLVKEEAMTLFFSSFTNSLFLEFTCEPEMFLTESGARFSKVPITFRARKAILCARCLHLRLKFCWF